MEITTNASANRRYVSSEVRFYNINDLTEMLGWSRSTVQKLFNDPKFPASDLGRTKVVEAHALIEFFSKRQSKENNRYWTRRELIDGRKR